MDYLIFQYLYQFSGLSLFFDSLVIFLAKDLGYFLLAFLAVFLIKSFKKYWQVFSLAILAGGVGRIITEVFRLFWYKPRPFLFQEIKPLFWHWATSSFPSGHASFFFGLSFFIYFFNRRIGLLFLGVSFLIALSRVIAGLHWPSDILGGALLGFLVAFLLRKFLKGVLKETPQ